MIICGKNAILETLRANKAVYKIWVNRTFLGQENNEVFYLAKKQHIKINYVDKKDLDKIYSGAHQGYIAEIEDFKYSTVDDILNFADEKKEQPFVVILDGIEDPHNLGSVIRVCECAGVHGIIIPKYGACSINETVSKTSAGAISYVKIAKVTNLNQTIQYLKDKGLWVYGIELGGEDFYEQNLKGPIALIIGSEGYGTKALVKKNCDKVLTLPMFGKVNSLNASVACGVSVFEVVRQRRK